MSDLTTAGATRIAANLHTGSFGSGTYIGLGDGTTAHSVSQTDLTGANKERKQVDSATLNTNTISYVVTFGPGNANFNWREIGVFNGPAPSDVMLVRKLQSIVNKDSSMTITLTVNVQFTA